MNQKTIKKNKQIIMFEVGNNVVIMVVGVAYIIATTVKTILEAGMK